MKDILANPLALLLLVTAAGSMLGAVRVGSVSLSGLGVLLAGLVAGWTGHPIPTFVMDFGLALFVYTVGLQAGPGFFEAFKHDGVRLIGLVAAVTSSMAATIVATGLALGLDRDVVVGILCGAFNSPLALASVAEQSPGPGLTTGFGLVFPFSLLLLIFLVRLLPTIIRTTPEKARREHAEMLRARQPEIRTGYFRVTNPACDGHTLGELHIGQMTGAVIAAIQSNGEVQAATADKTLHRGDLVKAVGSPEALDKCRVALGEATPQTIRQKREVVVRRIMVTRREIVGKTLRQLALQEQFDAVVTKVRRGGITLQPKATTILYYGDKVTVVVRADQADRLVTYLGNDIQAFHRTELTPAFVAMAAGALLGFVPIPLPGGIHLRLGIAGGILALGLVAGRLGKVGPAIFTMPPDGALVLRKLGSLLLMVALGAVAGAGLSSGSLLQAPKLLVPALAAVVVGLSTALLLVRRVFKADAVETVGLVAGSVANTAAMEAGCSALENEDPAGIYAVAYPLAIVAQIVAAQITSVLLGAWT